MIFTPTMQPSHKHLIPLNQDHSQKQKNIPQWHKAMNEEFDVLLRNSTWTLVLPQPTQNIIGCKWIFRVKRNLDGSIARYKAQLATKGFNQCPSVNFHDTFNPVVKPITIHVILTVVVSKGWHLHQLDINNVFLQDTIEDEVFIEQPHGFIDPQNPSYACKLRKAIYGLCQASQAWYNELHEFLLDFGFINAHMDTSLFIFHHGNLTLLLLVYVDDIILIGTSHGFIDQFVTTLADRFSLKDLNALSYFL